MNSFLSLFLLAVGLFIASFTSFGLFFLVLGLLQGLVAIAFEEPGDFRIGWMGLSGNFLAMILVIGRSVGWFSF